VRKHGACVCLSGL